MYTRCEGGTVKNSLRKTDQDLVLVVHLLTSGEVIIAGISMRCLISGSRRMIAGSRCRRL